MAVIVKLEKLDPRVLDQYMRDQEPLEDIDRRLMQLARVIASKSYFPKRNAKIGVYGSKLCVEFVAGRQSLVVYAQLDENDRIVEVLHRPGIKWYLGRIGAWLVSTRKDLLLGVAKAAKNSLASVADDDDDEEEVVDIVSTFGILHREGKETWAEAKTA